ncbi:hypothetical protein MMC07_005304 [Pseudocyphellaria aurata]|nr:hypothetical protein [Pseudocyphellaria aurata]
MVQTYSKRPKASAKSSSIDDSSICIALNQNVLDEISATTSKHKDMTTADVSPKESGSKPIQLLLSLKVNSLMEEISGSIDKAQSLKDSHTRNKLKRHRRASVHETAPTDGSVEDAPRGDQVAPVEHYSRYGNTAPPSNINDTRKTLSRIRRNVKLPVHESIQDFRFPILPFNSKKIFFAGWRPDSALTGLRESSQKTRAEPQKKKAKRTDSNGSEFLGLIAMPSPAVPVESFTSPRYQESLVHPEEQIPSNLENVQDPGLFEDNHPADSKGGPTFKSFNASDDKVLTKNKKRLPVSSLALSKDQHNSQTVLQVEQVLAPPQQLLKSKVRSLTEEDGGSLSIIGSHERSDWDRRNKASVANDVYLQTISIPPSERVTYLDKGETFKHLKKSSHPVKALHSTLKPPNCDSQSLIPDFFTPLRQLKQTTETETAKPSHMETNKSARLRNSISIKVDPQHDGDQSWRVTLTTFKGLRVDVQEEIPDKPILGLLAQPQRSLPVETRLDGRNTQHVDSMPSVSGKTSSLKR